VAAAFAVAMAVVLVATSWFLYVRLGSHLAQSNDRGLRVRAQDLTALVQEPGAPLAAALGTPFVEVGESYAQLLDSDRRVLDATRPLGRTPLLTAAELAEARQRPIFLDRSPVPGLDEPSRILATPVTRNGEPAVLVVGHTSEDREEALDGLRNELLIAGPAAFLLATLAGYLLAGLSLRPVESMRRRAEAISDETQGERLPVPQTRDELQRLAETLNEMLTRLEEAIDRERDFVADAGHELRTPLALLRTELELALRHAETTEDLRKAVRVSSDEVSRLAQLADDLLVLARFDRGQLPLKLEPLEASELLATVASRFEWRAQEAGRPIRTTAPRGLRLHADRIRLEQALGNLVDNALRHGEGEVRLSAAAVGDCVELHVVDEGAGLPPELVDRAFERFTRGDSARTAGGAGLGLSIVRVIAEAHGGAAYAAAGGQGADVWMSLPLARPSETDDAVGRRQADPTRVGSQAARL
jgi:heavy metal sensor kinase